jgi:hypothetical protein
MWWFMGVILHIVILMSMHKGNFFISLDKGRFTRVFYGLGGGRAWGIKSETEILPNVRRAGGRAVGSVVLPLLLWHIGKL